MQGKKSIFDEASWNDFRQRFKVQPYRRKQILHEIFKQQKLDFEDMDILPADLREKLSQRFYVSSLTIDQCMESEDTIKFLFRLHDNKIIESVIMLHFQEPNPGTVEYDNNLTTLIDGKKLNRLTLCISSQVGCAVNCVFCVTGKLGFGRNLTYYEIIEQVLVANNYLKNKLGKRDTNERYKIRNIVFMGMGEPFLNYENVERASRSFLDQSMFSLGRKHITISTSGIIPAIYKMVENKLPVMLAFSLHAPNQAVRQELIPTIAKKYPLVDLMEAIDYFTKVTGQRMFYEYIMIDKKTDSKKLAHELGSLLSKRRGHLNLIPYNTNPAIALQESDRKQIQIFKDIVVGYGVTTTIRNNHGRTIQGACGQLGYEVVKKYKNKVAEYNNLAQRDRKIFG